MSDEQETQDQTQEQTPGKTNQEDGTSQQTETSKAEPEKKSLLNEQDKAAGAPEKYSDFTVPEGYELDKEVATKATEIFKSLNLPQDSAQKLVDFYVAQSQEATNAPFKLWEDTQKQWQDAVKADPEIGGKLAEVKTTVSRAIDSLGDPKLAASFREAMDVTGVGNHPAFVKAFYKLASRLTEGKHVSGNKPSPFGQQRPGAPESAAKALYPDLP